MKTAQLSGSLRANVGKKDAKALRNEGLVPCVLYGQGEQTHFSVKQVQMEKIVFSPDVYRIELDLDGKKSQCHHSRNPTASNKRHGTTRRFS